MARALDPVAARREAVHVVRTLRDAGHDAVFAGGCVRDELLGLHPTDYDVATSATPDQVRSLFRRTHEVGAAFGVMLVPLPGGTIEVATFRTEGVYSDKRRPDAVALTTAEHDARRRDFTINALFLDPLAAPQALPAPLPKIEGRVIDHVGGVADLGQRLIRAVGDPERRLAEDHLRALRAVRFTARLGFTLDPATAHAIRRHATELAGVSRERVGEELRRMLEHPARAPAMALMAQLTLDAPVLDEPASPRSTAVLAQLPPDASYPAALAALALDRHAPPAGTLTEPAARQITSRWRKAICLSNAHRDLLADTLDQHRLLRGGDPSWLNLPVPAQKRTALRPGFREGLTLVAAQDAALATTIRSRLATLGVDITQPPPEPLLTGDDLIGLGLVPGPSFKRILSELYDAQLEGRVATRSAAMELARKLGV